MTTIAKALKEKNKLKNEIAQLQKRLSTYNSIIKGNPRPFDLNKTEQDLTDKISQLVSLKSAINKTNQPIQEKIFRLAEIKGLISFYKKLPVTEGKSSERYGSETNEYEVFFNEAVIGERTNELEKEADLIQDELESFNHKTEL